MNEEKVMVKAHYHPNAERFRYNNKQVVVVKEDDGFGLIFKIRTDDPTPLCTSNHVRGKVMETSFRLTKVSAEVVMQSLANQMGFKIIEK
jgi:hypothetical protein